LIGIFLKEMLVRRFDSFGYSLYTRSKLEYNTSMRTNRDRLIAEFIAKNGVTKLPHRKNKAFSSYLYSSRKAHSLARDAGMRKTGGVARARFDLSVQDLFDRAGEPKAE
jgi:hypothetical protein